MAHIRLANPRNKASETSLILRRGYNYSRGISTAGQLDMGLLFVCFQSNLSAGFLTIQKRLGGEPLEEYISRSPAAISSCFPEHRMRNAFLGQGLPQHLTGRDRNPAANRG